MIAPIAMALFLAAAPEPTVSLEHEPVLVCTQGQPLVVGARIVPVKGRRVFEPAVFVREAGGRDFQRMLMLPGGAVDTFVARIPAEKIHGDLDYFIETFDDEGKGPFRKGSPEAPLRIQAVLAPPAVVAPPPPPLPLPDTTVAPPPGPLPVTSAAALETEARFGWRSPQAMAGIGVLAVGVASFIGCGITGALAMQDYNREKAAATAGDQAAWLAAQDAKHTKVLAADVLLGVGIAGAAVGTGLVLWGVYGTGPTKQPVQVSFAPTPGGGAAVVSGRF